MSDPIIGILLIGLLFVFLAAGLEVALSLALVGVIGLLWLKGWSVGLSIVGSIAWSTSTSFELIAIPLFVFMSAILLTTGIGEGLYSAVARLVSFLPGGLAVATIFSCGIFAAVSGSSVATAATIGLIAIPEMQRRGYAPRLIFGAIAAGGTLGILIPPSIPFIIYGVMTETSIGHLYLAGILPGAVLSLLFTAYVMLYATIWPSAAPRTVESHGTARDILRSLYEIGPVALLIIVILGSMLAGIVTPTEAAGLGSAVSLALALIARALTWKRLVDSFHAAVRTTAMIMAIIIFASLFSHALALIGAPKALFEMVVGLDLAPWLFFSVVFLLLFLIAYALEELSVMIVILPILFPLVSGQGFDPIWFGVILVLWLQIGQITPPVGLSIFVVQDLMPGTSAVDVIAATTPYVLLMVALVALLFLFPELATWLPHSMFTR